MSYISGERQAFEPNMIRPHDVVAEALSGLNYQLSQANGFMERLSDSSGALGSYQSFTLELYYPESGEYTGRKFTVTRDQLEEAWQLLNSTCFTANRVLSGSIALDSAPEEAYLYDGYITLPVSDKLSLSCRPEKEDYEKALRNQHFNGEPQVKLDIIGEGNNGRVVTYRIDQEFHHESDQLLSLSLDIGDGFLRRDASFMDTAIETLTKPDDKNYGNAIVGALLSLASAVSVGGAKLERSQGDEQNLVIDTFGAHPGHHYQIVDLSDGRIKAIPGIIPEIYEQIKPKEILNPPSRIRASRLREAARYIPFKLMALGIGDLSLAPRLPKGMIPKLRWFGIQDPEMDKLNMRSVSDALTKLNNRHFIDSIPYKIIEQLQDPDFVGFSLTYYDIVGFGKFNKQHTQEVGDDVLRCVSAGLSNAFRDSDVVIRLGGDEFMVVSCVKTPGGQISEDSLATEFINRGNSGFSVTTDCGQITIKLRGGFAFCDREAVEKSVREGRLSQLFDVVKEKAAEDMANRSRAKA